MAAVHPPFTLPARPLTPLLTPLQVYITFVEYWLGVRDMEIGAAKFGFSLGDFGRSIGALFGLGFAFRVLALGAVSLATSGSVLPPGAWAWLRRGGGGRAAVGGGQGGGQAAGSPGDGDRTPAV